MTQVKVQANCSFYATHKLITNKHNAYSTLTSANLLRRCRAVRPGSNCFGRLGDTQLVQDWGSKFVQLLDEVMNLRDGNDGVNGAVHFGHDEAGGGVHTVYRAFSCIVDNL